MYESPSSVMVVRNWGVALFTPSASQAVPFKKNVGTIGPALVVVVGIVGNTRVFLNK